MINTAAATTSGATIPSPTSLNVPSRQSAVSTDKIVKVGEGELKIWKEKTDAPPLIAGMSVDKRSGQVFVLVLRPFDTLQVLLVK